MEDNETPSDWPVFTLANLDPRGMVGRIYRGNY